MSDADRYEARYPGTDIPAAQKEERMQRLDVRSRSRKRTIVVPDLPWRKP